ncbi:hypothetical protein Tco_0306617 [Tanacetum coccineum]
MESQSDSTQTEVIVNGDAPVVVSASTEGPIPPKTVEQKIARNNELKAKSTLLLAIPGEHLLNNGYGLIPLGISHLNEDLMFGLF